MIHGGTEFLIGTTRQEQFGRIVTLAIGGIHADFTSDAVHAYPPISRSHALDMIGSLRSQHLLDGVRGSPPVDRDALAALVAAFSLVSDELPDTVRSLELNPVVASGANVTAVDVSMLIDEPHADGDTPAMKAERNT